jgi:flagellar basal-body rod protein FlgB
MGDDANVIGLLEAGLRGTALRGKAIANNIANLNTPQYRRYTVEFEKALAEVLASGDARELRDVEMEVLQPRTAPAGPDGNDVDLDVEIGEMIKNGAAYKTYVRLMAKAYRQMELAMETGR